MTRHGAYVFVPLVEDPSSEHPRSGPGGTNGAGADRVPDVHGSPVSRAEREYSNSDRRT